MSNIWHISEWLAASPLSVFDEEVRLLSASHSLLRISGINRVFTHALLWGIVGRKKSGSLELNSSKSQRITDWLPTLWWVCGPFSSVTCCINIVVQTSLRAICLEFMSTPFKLTCENSQLCRCLRHGLMVRLSPTPAVGERMELHIYRIS